MGAVNVGGGGSGGAFVAFSLSGIACRPRPRLSASPPRAEAVAAAVAAAAAAVVAADVTAASARAVCGGAAASRSQAHGMLSTCGSWLWRWVVLRQGKEWLDLHGRAPDLQHVLR